MKYFVFLLFFSAIVFPETMVWQKCLGGSGIDIAYMIKVWEKEYVIVGETSSNDEDVSMNHGKSDAWVVVLNRDGKIIWERTFGGSENDVAYAVSCCTDSLIVAGSSYSKNFVKNRGKCDVFILRIDENGNVIWKRSIGGSEKDFVYDVVCMKDEGVVLVGKTLSKDGDFTGNHGSVDAWIAKLDRSGNLLWLRCFGGIWDDRFLKVQEVKDGFIVVGYTNSKDVLKTHGKGDLWIVKLDFQGNTIWQKCLGGSQEDRGLSLVIADDGYVVCGYSHSKDGDVGENHGKCDGWIVKVDKNGEILWKDVVGGLKMDKLFSICKMDEGYVSVGFSYSKSIPGWHGSSDFWILKLSESGNVLKQRCFGGRSWDKARYVTFDGEKIIVIGETSSSDGNVKGWHEGYDEFGDKTLDVWVLTLSFK
ncbi:MAG TPA: hypothetical protein ENG15_05010 [Thermotoga sp.]|nr:hypothetical protein [Thermotoga sp.]